MYRVGPCLLNIQFSQQLMTNNHTKRLFDIGLTMTQETSFYVDPPPSYAEAMECVQLSPLHLTQVMVDQQWKSRQNNNANPSIEPEEAFVKEQRMNKNNKIGRWIIQLAVLIFLIFVFIWITRLCIK